VTLDYETLHAADDNHGVGFNPFRQQQRRSSDYLMVAAAAVIVIALLVWALFS
jgi:hypothetical protein